MRRILGVIAAGIVTLSGAVAVDVVAAAPAAALGNGVAATPPMGWNDWNAFGCGVSEALVEQTAQAIVNDGLAAAGYQYVNIDDCWALPTRDANGNLVANPAKFPDGIKAVADFVHGLGLKLGIYEDSGSRTCSSSGGFAGSLGHENADALEFAQWGVDYLKYDDCNVPIDGQNIPSTIARYTAMRDALAAASAQTEHQILFSICEKTDFGVPNATWPPIGNIWRTTGDIKDTYAKMLTNFHTNVQLAALAGQGAFNDPDMLEIGNGGMTNAEYESEFSLWAEMAAPLIAGTDLRSASPATLAIYGNKDVIAVDQDRLAKQAVPVSSANGLWVLNKPLANGDRAVALFNETNAPATISTTAAAVGLSGAPAYALTDLWRHQTTETAGTISAVVAPHATVMYRVSPTATPAAVPPNVTFDVGGLAQLTPGHTVLAIETLTNNGLLPALGGRFTLQVPLGWWAVPFGRTDFAALPTGRAVQVTWQITEPTPDQPFPSPTVNASARYSWPSGIPVSVGTSQPIAVATPVVAPLLTASSTTSAFGAAGGTLGIRSPGTNASQYGSIYLPNAEQDGTTATVELTALNGTTDPTTAGLMVRNDITRTGNSPGFVTLAATPGHGYVLRTDSDGDGQLDTTVSAGTTTYPSWLKLTRQASTFTGFYSTDGQTWTSVGSATVPSAATNQDAGVFATATTEADFANLTVGPPAGLIVAPHTTVTWPGQATPVTATFWNHGTAPIPTAAITLSAPAGWTVSPAGPTTLGTVAAGGSANATWQVTPPAGVAPGATALPLSATYPGGTSSATVTAVVPSANLSSAYDNIGVTDDTNTSVGNVDGSGSSLSAQALAAVGVTPGSVVAHGGLTFSWPGATAGQSDNVVADGQSLAVSGSGGTLGFLATSTYGPATGTGTITYTDGSTQPFTLTVPDWFANPPAGSDPAITMTYRNRGGNTQQAHAITVFYLGVPLAQGKSVRGVVLPAVSATAVSGIPAMHVFAVAVG